MSKPTLPEPTRKASMFCTKCGYSGPIKPTHHNPNNSGDCGYTAFEQPDYYTETQIQAHVNEWLEYAAERIKELDLKHDAKGERLLMTNAHHLVRSLIK